MECIHYYREDSEVLGSHLLIHGVRREDFGQYTCQISNTWFQSVDTSVWLREIGKAELSVLWLQGVECVKLHI